jgi:hypothetical protein
MAQLSTLYFLFFPLSKRVIQQFCSTSYLTIRCTRGLHPCFCAHRGSLTVENTIRDYKDITHLIRPNRADCDTQTQMMAFLVNDTNPEIIESIFQEKGIHFSSRKLRIGKIVLLRLQESAQRQQPVDVQKISNQLSLDIVGLLGTFK